VQEPDFSLVLRYFDAHQASPLAAFA